jgi:hypothetical protein
MYGRIHYEDATGFSVVNCLTEADYQRELKAGCRWVEDETSQFRGMWGEILACQNCGGDGIDPGSLRKPEPCPPCKGEGSVFASMRRDEAISLFNQIQENRMHREGFGV